MPFLLGVSRTWSMLVELFSAISTALRHISRALLASPLTAATFRLANSIASGSTSSSGTLSRRDVMICISCSCVYPGKVIRRRPGSVSCYEEAFCSGMLCNTDRADA